jgi:hypothetical protein
MPLKAGPFYGHFKPVLEFVLRPYPIAWMEDSTLPFFLAWAAP